MSHPYKVLPEDAFWATSVSSRNPFEIENLWQPKLKITPKTRIVTYGSCFAQHFGAALRDRGYAWMSAERPPKGLLPENAARFGYDIFSSRTGNIYTTSLLKQWLMWAAGIDEPPALHWVDDGRVYDPFRPTIEPQGFGSVAEMVASRQEAIDRLSSAVSKANLFVFTMGLTESWFDANGWEYPMCPGTAAGSFDPDQHVFVNQTYSQIRGSLVKALKLLRKINSKIQVLLTVSPVPLTATNSGKHVLVATMYSKSTLRAAAGEVSDGRNWVDYFPSYEIINAPPFAGSFFESNRRNVSKFGVSYVMESFFRAIDPGSTRPSSVGRPRSEARSNAAAIEDARCDEELLEAFGPTQ